MGAEYPVISYPPNFKIHPPGSKVLLVNGGKNFIRVPKKKKKKKYYFDFVKTAKINKMSAALEQQSKESVHSTKLHSSTIAKPTIAKPKQTSSLKANTSSPTPSAIELATFSVENPENLNHETDETDETNKDEPKPTTSMPYLQVSF